MYRIHFTVCCFRYLLANWSHFKWLFSYINGGKFISKGHMNRHISLVHEGKKSLECSKCKSRFTAPSKLNHHIASVHNKNRPTACSICPAKFKDKASLRRHVESPLNLGLGTKYLWPVLTEPSLVL